MSGESKRPHDSWDLLAQDTSSSPPASKRPRIVSETDIDMADPSSNCWAQITSAPASTTSAFPGSQDHPQAQNRYSPSSSLASYPYPPSRSSLPLSSHAMSANPTEMARPLPVRPASASAFLSGPTTTGRSFSLPEPPSSASLPNGSADNATQIPSRQTYRGDVPEYGLPFDAVPHPTMASSSSAGSPSMQYYGVSSGVSVASSSGPSSAAMSRHSSSSRGSGRAIASNQSRALSATPTLTMTSSIIPSMAPPHPTSMYSHPDHRPSPQGSTSSGLPDHSPHYSHHRLSLALSGEETPTRIAPLATASSPSPPFISAQPSPILDPAIPEIDPELEPHSSSLDIQDENRRASQTEEKKGKGKHKGIPGPKARIPLEAKQAIGEHIIAKGVAMANVDELAQLTGLTKQQIKSQLVDNRQNIRKQLTEFVRSLQ
ncbi:hypothetical protein IAU59_004976 [Kwoniella sp. CBS 9459]